MATLVITGPSAVGKTYLADALRSQYGRYFSQAKLVTTRAPRINDAATDREFADAKTFEQLEKAGAFAAAGTYHGNRYGYRHEIFLTSDTHQVVNVWPEFLPELLRQNDTIALALTASPTSLPMLEERMKVRGDSEQTIEGRKKLILEDIATVDHLAPLIRQSGALFEITGNQDISRVVLPWVLGRFNIPQ